MDDAAGNSIGVLRSMRLSWAVIAGFLWVTGCGGGDTASFTGTEPGLDGGPGAGGKKSTGSVDGGNGAGGSSTGGATSAGG